jgi:hypothetical protein
MAKKKTKSFGAPLKAPGNQSILGALADAQGLARMIREALPVRGLEGSYPDESPAVRQRAEDEAAWAALRIARVTTPGEFIGIPGQIALPWESLGRVVSEIREHWGWEAQDGESRIPNSRARDGKKLKPLPAGILKRLESACRLLEAGARNLPDDARDPELEITREAYRLWEAGRHTWPQIAERLEKDRTLEGALKQRVKRYSKERGLPMRKGEPGAPRKN